MKNSKALTKELNVMSWMKIVMKKLRYWHSWKTTEFSDTAEEKNVWKIGKSGDFPILLWFNWIKNENHTHTKKNLRKWQKNRKYLKQKWDDKMIKNQKKGGKWQKSRSAEESYAWIIAKPL